MPQYPNISHGTSTDLGRRPSQQDEALVLPNLFDLPDHHLYAIFDGHGSEGGKVSKFVADLLPKLLVKEKTKFLTDPPSALKTIFTTLNERLCDNQAIDAYMSGTTAAVLIIIGNRLYAANVGDSRVVIGRRNPDGAVEPLALTTDHTCANPPELERVKASGARIEQLRVGEESCGPLRIFKGSLPYPGLVCTRSIGDAGARKLGITCEPEVTEYDFSPERDVFLIVASDGVWDGLSTSEVVALINEEYATENGSAEEASKKLTAKSLTSLDSLALDDNVTNIVVFFGR